MKLYQEILLLEGYFKKRWVVENVISWYDPLINPYLYKEHYYWSNFFIGGSPKEREYRQFHTATIKEMQNKLGIDISKYKGINKQVVLRNCVEPKDGLHIFNLAMEIDAKLDTEQYSLFK